MLSGYLLLQPKSYFPAFLCVTLNLFLMWKLWMLLRDMVQWFAFDLRCPLYLLQCRRLRCRIFWKVQSPASSRSRATRATYMDSPIPRIRRCLHGRPPCVVHRVKGVLWNWDRHHHSWASERDLVIERHILVRLNWEDRRSEYQEGQCVESFVVLWVEPCTTFCLGTNLQQGIQELKFHLS